MGKVSVWVAIAQVKLHWCTGKQTFFFEQALLQSCRFLGGLEAHHLRLKLPAHRIHLLPPSIPPGLDMC